MRDFSLCVTTPAAKLTEKRASVTTCHTCKSITLDIEDFVILHKRNKANKDDDRSISVQVSFLTTVFQHQ